MYDGVAIRRRRMLCAREINATLKMKKSAGPVFALRISLRFF
jgi:hypothetical protein